MCETLGMFPGASKCQPMLAMDSNNRNRKLLVLTGSKTWHMWSNSGLPACKNHILSTVTQFLNIKIGK